MSGILLYMNGDRGRMTLNNLLKHGYKVSKIILPMNCSIKPILEEEDKVGNCRILEVGNCNERQFIDYIHSIRPYLAIVAGFPQILSHELISIPTNGTINLHGGKLPEYRGGSPLNWQIINGESNIGISIIKMDSGIDTGPLIYETSFKLKSYEDISDAHRKANDLFAELSFRALRALEDGSIKFHDQEEKDAVYWHQRNSNDGLINWDNMTAIKVINMVRALNRPYPGAFSFRNGDKVKVYSASLPNITIKGVPGRVCYINKKGPFVLCSDRAIMLHNYTIDRGKQREITNLKLNHGDQLNCY